MDPQSAQRRGEARNALARGSSSACTTGPSPSCGGGSVTQTSRAGRIRVRTGLRVRLEGEQAKANTYVVGKRKGKGDGGCRQVGEKGCAGGQGTLGQDRLVGDSQYFYLGGLPPDLFLCCEAEVVTYGHMTREAQQ